jgi:hypothetical protein
MPSNPPVVADLEAEVAVECGLMLADVGLYLRSPDATTPAIRIGLRKGAKAVGMTISNPLVLQDSDVARLSTFAVERVMDEARLHSLQWVLLNWHRATQAHQEPLSATSVVSGYLVDEKRGIQARVAELKAICSEPYREPSDEVIVANRFGPTGPLAREPEGPYGPYYGPYGWGFGWDEWAGCWGDW